MRLALFIMKEIYKALRLGAWLTGGEWRGKPRRQQEEGQCRWRVLLMRVFLALTWRLYTMPDV